MSERGILMLAAGFSRRFGADKRRATLADGRQLLVASAQNALASGLPLRVCLRPDDEALAEALTELGAQVVWCDNAARGMGATLAQGIATVDDWQAALVALGDMPDVHPDTFVRVAAATDAASICRPTWSGTPGHPVGFGRDWFASLRQLDGERGARELLRQHGAQVITLALPDPGILRDVDTPQDLV
ncbi:nucleotidyltransferase family protein [Mangrovimicrobium sediminis]|uniref:Nucleotidyltransferase family protein n=1 Tax=Mangrovimicrobium sediminis TaxID=2562682 RepID=A0A4Z0M944_9GAMM|nr:nucleotidyltransferase family protein [Haliea sp. SAOS-164]TGD76051.1 nucleotidyltransferase family protein [Haliea sp. SAOS-164]